MSTIKNTIAVLSALLFLSTSAIAQTAKSATGIQFTKDKWAKLLAQAEAQNKLLFIDAYTTWCAPCKKLDKDVFTRPKVGTFYNDNFINAKMDMERGEGPDIATKYNIIAYPTLLFIGPGGTLVHRSAGYHTPEEMITLGEKALDPNQRLGALEARYQQGDRDPGFLLGYAQSRREAMDGSHEPIAEAYLATQNDLSTPENMQLIYEYVTTSGSSLFQQLASNRPAFDERFGAGSIEQKIQQIIYYEATESPSSEALEAAAANIAKAYPERGERLAARLRIAYYRDTNQPEQYAQAASQYLKQHPSKNADELNNIAWSFYELVEDRRMLRKAARWAKASIKLDDIYYNNDTLAALYYKLGKKRKALKVAKRAVQLAEKEGEDYTETSELIEKINAMK